MARQKSIVCVLIIVFKSYNNGNNKTSCHASLRRGCVGRVVDAGEVSSISDPLGSNASLLSHNLCRKYFAHAWNLFCATCLNNPMNNYYLITTWLNIHLVKAYRITWHWHKPILFMWYKGIGTGIRGISVHWFLSASHLNYLVTKHSRSDNFGLYSFRTTAFRLVTTSVQPYISVNEAALYILLV